VNVSQDEIDKLGTWFSIYDFGPGLTQKTVTTAEVTQFPQRADRIFGALEKLVMPSDCTLLDIGCSDGFFSIEAAKRGYKSVCGIDFRSDSIQRAELAARFFDLTNIEFKVGDAHAIDEVVSGPFDVVLFLGLFYHLSSPLLALEKAKAITGKAAAFAGWVYRNSEPVFHLKEEDTADIRNGTRRACLVPSASGIVKAFDLAGFKDIVDLSPSPEADWREYVARV
jgi:2-polyprenyl-3-methyl-5-hydroxy-6-metoxy-1,4-benzoquinol methylase